MVQCEEREQQLALQPEHLPFLLPCVMVIPQQVQHTMNGEQHHLLHRAVTGRLSLLLRHPRADHDVAEHPLWFVPLVPGRSSSIGKLITSVGP